MILLSEEDVLNSQGKKFNRETRGVDNEGSLFINIDESAQDFRSAIFFAIWEKERECFVCSTERMTE